MGLGSDISDSQLEEYRKLLDEDPSMAAVYTMLRHGRGHEARDVMSIIEMSSRTEAAKALDLTPSRENRYSPEVTAEAKRQADDWALRLTIAVFFAIRQPEAHPPTHRNER